MKIKTPQVSDIQNKTVLVRTDYNVPLTKTLRISNHLRIDNSLETINFLLKNNAKVIIVSHLGRLTGLGNTNNKLSLKPIFNYLKNQKKLPISFATKFSDIDFYKSKVVLLENIRFYKEETQNNTKFIKTLASLADVYINEAFSVSHRNHASINVGRYIPSFAGFDLAHEVEYLSKLLENPKRPFVILVGGAKISDKVAAIKNLSKLADTILVGGAAANHFLKAEHIETHKSILEKNYVKVAEKILDQENGPQIIFPIDAVASKDSDSKQTKLIELSKDYIDTEHDLNIKYFDIGPKTTKLYSGIIAKAQTIFWNGPMGVFEKSLFGDGTKKIARAIASSKATSVVGGGDTVAAIESYRITKRFTFISSAGGAALKFLAGEELVGLRNIIVRTA